MSLTDTLTVRILNESVIEYDTHWNFTGRYRYRAYLDGCGAHLEVEVHYQGYQQRSRKVGGWWDKFWNGTFEVVWVNKTLWVDSNNFFFTELKPIYTYACGFEEEEPEVTYG